MAEHKFKTGDRVRCISTEYTYRSNRFRIEVGKVYTIKGFAPYSNQKLILQEVEDEYATLDTYGFYFQQKDFVPEDEMTASDANSAWDRAMSVL